MDAALGVGSHRASLFVPLFALFSRPIKRERGRGGEGGGGGWRGGGKEGGREKESVGREGAKKKRMRLNGAQPGPGLPWRLAATDSVLLTACRRR